jgi:hypothetical protein
VELPRLWQLAMEMVRRRRRPVLDYATPEPRRTFREWLDDAGGPGWMLLLAGGAALIVIRLLYFERRSGWGYLIVWLGLACVGVALEWRRRTRSEPF